MLTSINRLTGLPVMWQNREMGYVERAIADWQSRRLGGLVVRRGIGGARWSAPESITQTARQRVEVNQRPARMPEAELPAERLPVFVPEGYAGQLCDVLFHSDTFTIAALEITRGPLYRLFGYCAYASHWQQRPDGGLAVPALLTWAQLRTQFGEEDIP